MFDPNQSLPDFQTQELEIQRKRAMADMLRKQSGTPAPTGQMVGGQFIAPSFAQYLPGLLNSLQSGYAESQAAKAEKDYGQQVAQAKQQWQSMLPQATAGIPGREELYGPQEMGGSPELAAVPEVAPTRPSTDAVLKATIAGLNIPGNERVAQLYGQGMMAENTREDQQKARQEETQARMAQERELRMAALTQQKAIADQNAANAAASNEQRAEAARESARLREMMIESQREGRTLALAVRAANRGSGGRADDDAAAAGKGTLTVRDENGRLTTVTKQDAVRRGLVEVKNDAQLPPQEIQKREALFPKAKQAVQTVNANMDTLAQDLETLANHPGLSGITGIVFGRTPGITPQAREAEALYNKIVARGGFSELQAMRAASPTGGALGNVSNQEGTQLKQAFAEIGREQATPSMQKALKRAAENARLVKQRAQEAYDDTYEYRGRMEPDRTVPPGGRPAGAPAPSAPAMSPQDAQALEWANANPSDPRAAAIRQRLKVR